ncbi:MAG TPA: molybdate ABC transporter substrate-binding protein, partial [Rhodanobacteraceae bacterium]|nr:molybdate ABC transporter substrate-binding protein [Rhodanobacteraceae bacterium]
MLGCALWLPAAALAAAPTIFAAASLKPALDDLASHGALGTPAPRLVYGASSSLARQIEQGAPADLFMSADEDWMDDVAKHGEVVAATRHDLLGNALVLVAPADSATRVDLSQQDS